MKSYNTIKSFIEYTICRKIRVLMILQKKNIHQTKLFLIAGGYLKQAAINLFCVCVLSGSAIAANFQIAPTSLDLGNGVKSGAFSVINNGDEKLDVQISLEEWRQEADGKDVYGDTKDIVFFPKIMTVEPHEQRAVRIGFKGPLSLQERTYRIFVEELPSSKTASGEKAEKKIMAGLTIAFRYAAPIFVKPVRQQESGVMNTIDMSKGVAKTSIKNTGNIHIKLRSVMFSGRSADGKEQFVKEVAGWYILSGQSRPFEATVPRDLCDKITVIEVTAQSENFTMDGTLNVQKRMCTQ